MITYIRSGAIYDDSRATKEIKALLKAGFSIHVIGWDKAGDACQRCKSVFGDSSIHFSFYQKRVKGGLGFRGIFKLLGFFMFCNRQIKKELKIIEAIHACDLDGAIVASKICKKNKIKLIYDIYDYYIDTHKVPSIIESRVEKAEIEVINNAALTVICTEERKEQINKSNPQKTIVIYNSPQIDNSCNKTEEKYDYSYCGTLSDMRLIEEIVLEYSKHPDLVFCFAGSGRMESLIKETAAKYENFFYLGAIPYDAVLEIEKQSKVISAIYEPSIRNHRLCAPNKFYEALALSKPVIVCNNTGIDKIANENNAGIAINYSAEEFYQELIKLRDDPELRNEMGNNGRTLYDKYYSWSLMEQLLINEYKRLLNCS